MSEPASGVPRLIAATPAGPTFPLADERCVLLAERDGALVEVAGRDAALMVGPDPNGGHRARVVGDSRVMVNGQLYPEARLFHGDAIQIGDAVMIYALKALNPTTLQAQPRPFPDAPPADKGASAAASPPDAAASAALGLVLKVLGGLFGLWLMIIAKQTFGGMSAQQRMAAESALSARVYGELPSGWQAVDIQAGPRERVLFSGRRVAPAGQGEALLGYLVRGGGHLRRFLDERFAGAEVVSRRPAGFQAYEGEQVVLRLAGGQLMAIMAVDLEHGMLLIGGVCGSEDRALELLDVATSCVTISDR